MKSYEGPCMRVIRLHNDDVVVTKLNPGGTATGSGPKDCETAPNCAVFPPQGDPAETVDPNAVVY